MEIYTVSKARNNLFQLIDHVADSHEPIYLTGKRNNVVMISEEDYRSLLATLHISSIPGMKEAILEAAAEPIEKCTTEIEWE